MFRIKNVFLTSLVLLFIVTGLLTGCYPIPKLIFLEVSPDTMILYPGESQSISSITVYFQDNSQEEIPIELCEYSASNSNARVDSSGMITALSIGTTQVTVYYSKGSVTVSDTIQVIIASLTDYRALCIGINDYRDPAILNLRAPSYDVTRMREVFENSYFGEMQTPFVTIDTLIDGQATRLNILQSIQTSFSTADSHDVSYFYFSGHGWSDGSTATILPYDAIAADSSNDISVNDLASALGSIAGTKVVILDSCYSGGFIGKEFPGRGMPSPDSLREYNESVLESFALQDAMVPKSSLASSLFKVIVSASGDQICHETLNHPIDGYPYGYFSAALCEGCGYNQFSFPAPADSTRDRQITLNEIYQYISIMLNHKEQDVQVYPLSSSFIFIEY